MKRKTKRWLRKTWWEDKVNWEQTTQLPLRRHTLDYPTSQRVYKLELKFYCSSWPFRPTLYIGLYSQVIDFTLFDNSFSTLKMQFYLATSCLVVSLLSACFPQLTLATFHKEEHHAMISKVPYPVEHIKYVKVRLSSVQIYFWFYYNLVFVIYLDTKNNPDLCTFKANHQDDSLQSAVQGSIQGAL